MGGAGGFQAGEFMGSVPQRAIVHAFHGNTNQGTGRAATNKSLTRTTKCEFCHLKCCDVSDSCQLVILSLPPGSLSCWDSDS